MDTQNPMSTVWPLPVRGEPFARADADIVRRMDAISAATACAKLHGMGVTRTAVQGPTASGRSCKNGLPKRRTIA